MPFKTSYEISLQLLHNKLEYDTSKHIWSQTCYFKFLIIHVFKSFIS